MEVSPENAVFHIVLISLIKTYPRSLEWRQMRVTADSASNLSH